ncbi:hypothetical protein [Kibdelosporangium aridum]|uniref:hypothetical protein n=1 Tax=Kibdelosporangium aridum TaxID=2030 RepID=UPI0035EFFA46
MTESGGWSSPDDQSRRPQDPPAGQQPPYPMPPPPQQWGPPPAAKPGVIPLRPLGLGEILDGAIAAIRSYPKQMLGVSALVSTISNLLLVGVMFFMIYQTDWLYTTLPLSADEGDRAIAELQATLILTIPSIVITMLVGTFLNGVLTVVMGKAVLGQPVTVGEAWNHIKPRFGALLGLSVLYTLIVIVGTVLLVIPGIWLYVLLSLASTALILEGATVGKAFGRSRLLVTGAWWRTCGILLLAVIMASLLAQIVQIPLVLAGGGLNAATGGGFEPNNDLMLLLTALAGIIAETITRPFTSGVTTLIYIDRRMRREGMDIELARQAGVTPPQYPQQQQYPPQQPPTAW